MVSFAIPSGGLSSGVKMTESWTSFSLGTPGTKPGFGAALFAEKAFGHKIAGRVRLEYMAFGEKNKVFDSESAYDDYTYEEGHKGGANAIAVMADCIYRFDSHDKGTFCFAGAGLMSAKSDYAYYIDDQWPGQDNDSLKLSKSKSSTVFGISFGLGYNFNQNLGIEAKYTKGLGAKASVLKIEDVYDQHFSWGEESLGFDFIQLSIGYRF
jgi:opacity protein-like surface antigen